MTINEIESRFKLHHTASRRGYVSRKIDGIVEPYKGKFGEGYVIIRPRFDTTRFVTVEYYVEVAR